MTIASAIEVPADIPLAAGAELRHLAVGEAVHVAAALDECRRAVAVGSRERAACALEIFDMGLMRGGVGRQFLG